jgi:hypothetical protein
MPTYLLGTATQGESVTKNLCMQGISFLTPMPLRICRDTIYRFIWLHGRPGPLRIEKCKPKTKAAPASDVAEHVHTATQHSQAIAEVAAAELAPTDGASARMSEDVMHDIVRISSQKRVLKGKAPPHSSSFSIWAT